jgi:hypothetical protein
VKTALLDASLWFLDRMADWRLLSLFVRFDQRGAPGREAKFLFGDKFPVLGLESARMAD